MDRLPAGEWRAALALLAEAGLPTADLTPAAAGWFLAARDGGGLMGVVAIQPCGEAGLLRSLAVRDTARGQGLGRELVAAAERDAQRLGLKSLYLLTTTAESFFLALGYRASARESVPAEIAQTTEFAAVCPSSARCLMKRLAAPMQVLFLCTGNSARSQMAEAVLNRDAGGRFQAESAGSEPAAVVNPLAVAALAAAGIEWAGHPPRGLEGLNEARYDIIITVCDRAREACPIFPGRPILAHWGMPDPAAVAGDESTRRRAFDLALQLIRRRIDLLLALPANALDRMVLEQRVREIGGAS